jgi:glycosyltransferase involved in cell wall biosynthesis
VTDLEGRRCDLAISVAPPKSIPWFSGVDSSIAIIIDRLQEWVGSSALDASTALAVTDDIAAAQVDASWGRDLAQPVPDLVGDDPAMFPRLLELVRPGPNAMRIGVSTCAPDRERAQFWGDTHLARGLMRAFRRLGHESTELILDDWIGSKAASCDVVVHLRGLTRRPTARGQWNVLWIISHPDRLEPGECDDYDLLATASLKHAAELSSTLGRRVHYLPQATDADTFRTGLRDPAFETSVLYVGNARWPHRRAPRWMMRSGRPFALYGKNWDKTPEASLVVDDYISNRDLPKAYRSASVVVADHHGSMRTNGFVANRLFDVLASGGVVLTDNVEGLEDLFGEVVPAYADPRELESQLRLLLSDPVLRRSIARTGRDVVMSGHTLDHRARTILEWLDDL